MSRSPAFAIASALTLAIGIGLTTAISSIVDAVLVRPLPLPDSDRLVLVRESELPRTMLPTSYPEYLEWRSRATTLAGLAAASFNPQAMVPTREGTARLSAAMISTNYFDVVGARAALGRVISESDGGGLDVAVLSHDAWQTYFRSDPNAVGSALEVRGNLSGPSNLGARPDERGRLLTIVGVLPQEFDSTGASVDFYTPLVMTPGGRPPIVTMTGRLRQGVSIAAATEEANAIGTAVRPLRPATEPPLTVPRFRVVPIKDDLVDPVRPALNVFVAAVGVVLLIACANIANLLLARGTARAQQIATRRALGASRGRIVRQLLTECVLLSLLGAVTGAALGAAAVGLVKRLATIDAQGVLRFAFSGDLLPRIAEVSVDARMFAIAFGLSVITTLVFGLLPSVHVSGLQQVHLTGARGETSSRRQARMPAALVLSQMIMATVLLVAAGLLVASFINLSRVEKGYDPSNALAFQLVLPAEYASARKEENIESLLAALRRLPEVQSAGFAYAGILLGLEDTVGTFVPPGRSLEEMQNDAAKPRLKSLSTGYLRSMGVPLLSGRELDGRDNASAPLAAMINRTVARRFFGETNPIGATLLWRPGPMTFAVEVVGVVEDIRQGRVSQPPYAEIFMDYRQVLDVQQRIGSPKQRAEQVSFGFLSFGVRTYGDPAQAIPAVRATVRWIDAYAGIDAIHTMDRMVNYSIARQKFYAIMFGVFASVAGLLAAIGVYAVLAYAVAQRTREIGVRMALGAARRDVLALVLGRGLVLAAVGIAVGLAGAFAGARYLQSMLFGIEPRSPGVFAAVALMFAGVAVAAAYLPAERAARVDPVALRAE